MTAVQAVTSIYLAVGAAIVAIAIGEMPLVSLRGPAGATVGRCAGMVALLTLAAALWLPIVALGDDE